MRNLSTKEIVLLLGYELHKDKKDVFKVNHPFQTSPLSGNGGINYFEMINDVEKWAYDMINFRRLTNDENQEPLAYFMLKRRNQI